MNLAQALIEAADTHGDRPAIRLDDTVLTYSDLLAQARKEAAEVYMHEEKLTMAEIAGLLGYSDQTAFMRAFRGWFGESPGAYREKLRGE